MSAYSSIALVYYPFQEALATARKGGGSVRKARKAAIHRDRHRGELQRWNAIFSLPLVLLFTGLFGFFAVVDLLIGWGMYREMVKMVFPTAQPAGFILLVGIAVNLIAVVASHLFALCLNGDLYRWRLSELIRRDGLPADRAAKMLRARRLRYWLQFGFVTLAYLALVAWFGDRRIALFDSDPLQQTLEATLLAWSLFFSFLEVVTGIFLAPFFQWAFHAWHEKQNDRRFRRFLNQTLRHDQETASLLAHCQPTPASQNWSQDLRDAIERFRSRSGDEGYCDPGPPPPPPPPPGENRGETPSEGAAADA